VSAGEYGEAVRRGEAAYLGGFWKWLGARVRRRMPWLFAAVSALAGLDRSVTLGVPGVISVTLKLGEGP
jgi:hypothetical protein